MQIAILHLGGKDRFGSSDDYLAQFSVRHEFYTLLKKHGFRSVDIIQRAAFASTQIEDTVTYHFIKDNLPARLRWWQEPESTFEFLGSRLFDILQVDGFDLPLHFRWIRRAVGKATVITGVHTGEKIWPSRNLWLQQFGLRVVDGFIFEELKDAYPWQKASVILRRQPVFECRGCRKHEPAAIAKMNQIYKTLSVRSLTTA